MARQTKAKFPANSGRCWTAEDAQEELAAWEQSGLTMAAFCQRRGIRPARLYWWRKRLSAGSERAEQQSLVPVSPSGGAGFDLVQAVLAGANTGPSENPPSVDVRLASGDRIVVVAPMQIDPDWVVQVAQGLSAHVQAQCS